VNTIHYFGCEREMWARERLEFLWRASAMEKSLAVFTFGFARYA
jgi:hypothetical protein